MKFQFSANSYFDFRQKTNKSNPLITIENGEKYGWFFNDEIQNLYLNKPYLNEIVVELEKVINTDMNKVYSFGYEAYLIECHRNKSLVKDMTENEQVVGEIKTTELFEMLSKWCDFVNQFEEKHLSCE